MGSRSKNATRCWRCRMHIDRCVCAAVPDVDIATRVIVAMHYREWHKTTATAPLMALAVPSCEIRLRGKQGTTFDASGLDDPNRRPMVLFPADDAEVLSTELLARDPRPVTLVVPDGNWGQASRAVRREPSLRELPRVILPDLGATRYRLRTEPRLGGLATYEAISRALGILEGPALQAQLDHLFDAMVEATLTTRGA
ncbi:MAG: DTW domain-containing protein [Deltaproteobacteria bacterium]|nr:DTW domain-containing protein [Deltaproteobacteria bacterium]